MGKQSSMLDGPRMGYGPVQQERRGVPVLTVVLAVVCVVLVLLLVLSLAGRRQSAATSDTTAPPAASGVTASPSGMETPPPGAGDTVAVFLAAWSLAPSARADKLASVTVTGLPASVPDATAATLAAATPVGPAAYTQVGPHTLTVSQPLSGGATVQLRLGFESAAVYGWLVSSVQLDV